MIFMKTGAVLLRLARNLNEQINGISAVLSRLIIFAFAMRQIRRSHLESPKFALVLEIYSKKK